MIGDRQRQLLEALLEQKQGLTADALAERLGISRSAVQQHLTVLERDGYINRQRLASDRGRPGHAYTLTERGIEVFPKQYALFSDLLIESMKTRLGSAGLAGCLRALGRQLAEQHRGRLAGLDERARIEEVGRIMRKLGYQARTVPGESAGALPRIAAHNCVYHHLAARHREVCELDLALLGALLGREIIHEECMVRGGRLCRFRAGPVAQQEPETDTDTDPRDG